MDIKAGDWIVVDSYGFDVRRALAVKPQTVTYETRDAAYQGRVAKHKVVFSHADEAKAEVVQQKLKSAQGVRSSRVQAAHAWFDEERARILRDATL